jgi:hypothetical protein
MNKEVEDTKYSICGGKITYDEQQITKRDFGIIMCSSCLLNYKQIRRKEYD